MLIEKPPTTWQQETAKWVGRLQSWKQQVQDLKLMMWFNNRAFIYPCDEPYTTATTQAQARWKAGAAFINLARGSTVWPSIKTLVTTTIDDAKTFTNNNPTELINWLVPVVNYMHDNPNHPAYKPDPYKRNYLGNQSSNYTTFRNTPNHEVWLYLSCMSHGCTGGTVGKSYYEGWPDYVIDEQASKARAMGWLCYLYNVRGELYYAVTHKFRTAWTDQYDFGGHGEGTLFYPGNQARVGGTSWIPIESMRLKHIRDGREDYEYLRLAQAAPGQSRTTIRAIAQKLFQNAYTTKVDEKDLMDVRQQLANIIDPVNVPYP